MSTVSTTPDASLTKDARSSRRAGGGGIRRVLTGERLPLIVGLVISCVILVGMIRKSQILMLVGVLAALLISVASPGTGLVVLAFMAPLKPPPAIPAPGFNLILISAILLGCVYRLPIERPQFRAAPALLLLAAFVLYAFVQQLPALLSGYADPRAHDVGYLFYQLLAGFGTIVAAGLALRNRSPYPVLVALLLSAVIAVALAIVTADGGGSLEGLVAKSDLASRASGPFGNPNNFGQFLAYACTLAGAWFVTAGSSRVRLALVVAVGVIGFGLSLSLSRGAVATLLAGLVALAFTRGRALGLAAVAAALVLVIVGYPLLVEWRLTNETGSASAAAAAELAASDVGRFGAILAAPALLAMSPVFGIGFGQYQFMSALVTDAGGGLVAHNWYGTVLAEQGLLGVALWLLMLVSVGMWVQSLPARPRTFGGAMLGAVTVGCLFLAPPTSLQTSVIPVIVITAALAADWSAGSRATNAREQGIVSEVGQPVRSLRQANR